MTRTQKLANKIREIYIANKAEVDSLPTSGPGGGTNAKRIEGWAHSPNSTISKAFGLACVIRMNWWDGPAPTPATAIPDCMYDDVKNAYDKIFHEYAVTDGLTIFSVGKTEKESLAEAEREEELYNIDFENVEVIKVERHMADKIRWSGGCGLCWNFDNNEIAFLV
jgi:hypothetical protein